MYKPKQITIHNKSGIKLKVLVLTDKVKYQTQEPRTNLSNNRKRVIILPDNFSRLILSKE